MHRSVLLGMVSSIGLLVASPALASPADIHPPSLRAGPSQSLNWSGYAVTGDITDVQGSWIIPAVTCAPGEYSYSAFWTGIDGFNSGTVEQTGTSSDCVNGVPRYYAWYEFFPSPSRTISGLTVSAGDVISAEVRYDTASGRFVVTIEDVTTNQSFTTRKKAPHAARSSAEWIAEAPSAGSSILPLADFGTADFGFDYTGVSPTCFATVGGTAGAIGTFGAAVQTITMVTSSGGVKASPSALSSDGTSFSVTWKTAGP